MYIKYLKVKGEKTRVTITIPKPLAEKLVEEAWKEGKSLSLYIYETIMRERGDAN